MKLLNYLFNPCLRGKHDWGPKFRWTMYEYAEACKRPGCKAILINNKKIIFQDINK